jgi:TolA-binding protein
VNRFAGRIVMIALLVGGAACSSMTPRFLMPASQRDWKPTLDRAQSLAATGRAQAADSVLANFAASYPNTAGAREALYWRSLIQLQSGFVSENGPAMLLDQYLGYRDADHLMEAATLRRVATRVDSLARAANALTTKVQSSNGEVVAANNRAADAKSDAKAVTADNKDQDAEIKRLRGELAAAKEELERIKKRLAEPAKKPPPSLLSP